ncbi:MAG: FdtA/QdtA family cupin domain-containing protein [Christensenellaceae bacterium]
MYNVGQIKLKKITDGRGNLTPIEGKKDIPFEIKRVYYLTNVAHEIKRGKHSHKQLHQVLVCLNGSVKIKVDNTVEAQEYVLDNSCNALYIGPLVWREMYDFSENAVLLVLASEYYDENDYIREYDEFMIKAKELFS